MKSVTIAVSEFFRSPWNGSDWFMFVSLSPAQFMHSPWFEQKHHQHTHTVLPVDPFLYNRAPHAHHSQAGGEHLNNVERASDFKPFKHVYFLLQLRKKIQLALLMRELPYGQGVPQKWHKIQLERYNIFISLLCKKKKNCWQTIEIKTIIYLMLYVKIKICVFRNFKVSQPESRLAPMRLFRNS